MEYLILILSIIGIAIYFLYLNWKETEHKEDLFQVQEDNRNISTPLPEQEKDIPYKKYDAYLDIETTSLSPSNGDLTVIGLYLEYGNEHKAIQLVEDEISSSKLIEIMKKAKLLYTFNGTTFDLPYIKAKLGVDLSKYCIHKDLMFECRRRNLYGGFKEVEGKLGITRKLTGIDGRVAVALWRRYRFNGDKSALTTLLEYNKEDVSNLRVLKYKLNIRKETVGWKKHRNF